MYSYLHASYRSNDRGGHLAALASDPCCVNRGFSIVFLPSRLFVPFPQLISSIIPWLPELTTMARRRRERSPSNLKLKQPDRSGPSEKTLLQLAEERGLFDQAKKREVEIEEKTAPVPIPRPPKNEEGDDDEEAGLPPTVERAFETVLWSVSLAMLHFTLDVLVQHQYSVDSIVWPKVWMRFGQALLGKVVRRCDATAFGLESQC